jgi:hypothetical protein
MTPELTTGETSFELILDNLPTLIGTQSEILRLSNLTTLDLDNTYQEIEAQIFLSDNDYWQAKTATGFLTGAYFKDETYSDGLLNVSVPANATSANRTGSIVIEFYKDGIGKSMQIPVFQNA